MVGYFLNSGTLAAPPFKEEAISSRVGKPRIKAAWVWLLGIRPVPPFSSPSSFCPPPLPPLLHVINRFLRDPVHRLPGFLFIGYSHSDEQREPASFVVVQPVSRGTIHRDLLQQEKPQLNTRVLFPIRLCNSRHRRQVAMWAAVCLCRSRRCLALIRLRSQ